MREKKNLDTRSEIILCATKLFLEKGYTGAYVTAIVNALKISTGNLTFHFPTKEHILAELIKEMCVFQSQIEEQDGQAEYSLPVAYFLELVMFASLSEENPNIKDLILATYTHSMSIEIIRANDTMRAMRVFGEFCPNWTETEFIQAENVVSGIEYAMFRTENTERLSFEQRVTSSMEAIMKIYQVPEKSRQDIIAEVMAADYRTKGRLVFERFCDYVKDIGEL